MLANTALRGGAAFYSEGGFVKVVNCTAVDNRAADGSFLLDVRMITEINPIRAFAFKSVIIPE